MEEENLPALERAVVRVGCAGWSVPGEFAGRFPAEGTHLERYGRRFSAVEIDSSFYRPHRPATYARWAASVPEGFRFAVKVPREITHRLRLAVESGEALERFLGECGALGAKRGPLLLQLPPSLAFEGERVAAFFTLLRARYAGSVVCEPRHPSWFVPEVDELLTRFRVARVAADPAVVAEAARPGGWPGLVYYRLHGSPRVYYSAYGEVALEGVAGELAAARERSVEAWCIFDNTAVGSATGDALAMVERLADTV